jgi:hypothetical protein
MARVSKGRDSINDVMTYVMLGSLAASVIAVSILVLPRFLPAGVPAMLTLVLSVATGAALGMLASQPRHTALHSWVSFRAYVTCTTACVFWLWAAAKVVLTGDADLGCISFALLIAASVNTIRTASDHLKQAAAVMRLQQQLGGATAAVCANHLYVLIIASNLPGTFQLYLVVGVTFWAATVRALPARRPLCVSCTR